LNPYIAQVASALEAIRFSATSYSWLGRKSPISKALPGLSGEAARNYLLYDLQQQLYFDFYIRGSAAPPQPESRKRMSAVVTPFMRELSRANRGTGYWEPGWSVLSADEARVVASKNGFTLWARRQDCLSDSGVDFRAGTRVSLKMPAERLGISPGFYTALSDTPRLEEEIGSIVRFYWNVTPEGAIQLMGKTTSRLNEAKIAFQLKTLKDDTRYDRCDAAVLYVAKGSYRQVRLALESFYADTALHLKDGVPAFSKQLAPGLGFAEDPGSGESFGQNRCRLLAQALFRAHDEGRTTLAARMQMVSECFAEAALSLDAPYLNPGSHDDYPSWSDMSRRAG
jgi:hypothetical protein